MIREKETGHQNPVFVHDHVTNANDYPEEALNEVYGRSHHFRHMPPVYKVDSGDKMLVEYDRKDGKHISYERAVMLPKNPCDCKMNANVWPSASPADNLAENAQGYLRQLVLEKCKTQEGRLWSGSVKKKMKIVVEVIEKLNKDKAYWKRLLQSGRKRFAWVGAHRGELYDA